MHRYREQTDSCQRGGMLGDRVKKVKGLSKKTPCLQDTDNSMGKGLEEGKRLGEVEGGTGG